ncbi:hypothetical protein RHSIM_Rhsim02G0042800 [Rhododendron simsii]|uniref:Uncharacterized protein n=2 Tax=Rhododendron TaxID=4346 RepID=A0A834HCW0_RHOSS|nr:hypothetical protein RHSIM_Rhsim02G0042800 [Rhododendron simsii]
MGWGPSTQTLANRSRRHHVGNPSSDAALFEPHLVIVQTLATSIAIASSAAAKMPSPLPSPPPQKSIAEQCHHSLIRAPPQKGISSMDKRAKDFGNVKSSSKVKPLLSVGSEKIQLNGEIEGDEEKVSLLPPRRGGMSKSPGKPRLKVQWNDKDGSKLAEVVEFQRSDASDSDDEDSDSCICAIM